jgi:ABC-type transporter MlaC component
LTINSIRVRAVLALATLAVAVSACGSSGGKPAASTPAGSQSAATTGNVDSETRTAVAQAFTLFFNSKTKVAQSEAVLQHGPVFHKTLIQQGKSNYAKNSSVKVTSVNKVSKKIVAVKFTVISGSIHFPYQGNAVREGGKWKVAAKTLCGLLKVEGDAPAACKKASVTALPH